MSANRQRGGLALPTLNARAPLGGVDANLASFSGDGGVAAAVGRLADQVTQSAARVMDEQAAEAGQAAGRQAGSRPGFAPRRRRTIYDRAFNAGAVDTAAQAGNLAGLNPEFEPREDGTDYGRAFDAAALRTYEARVLVDLQGKAVALAEQFGADTVGLKTALDTLQANAVGSVPEVMRGDIGLSLARLRVPLERDAARAFDAVRRQEAAAAVDALVASESASIDRIARSAGLDGVGEATLVGAIADLRTRLMAHAPPEEVTVAGEVLPRDDTRTGALRVDQVEQILRDAETRARGQRIIGTFERLPGLEAKQAFFERFQAETETGEGLSRGLDLDQAGRLATAMRTDLRTLEAERRAEVAEMRAIAAESRQALRAETDTITRALAAGFAVDPRTLQGLATRARSLGDEGLASSLTGMASEVEARDEGLSLSAVERAASMRALEGKANPSEADIGRLAGLRAADAVEQRALQSGEALTLWGQQTGRELTPINVNDLQAADMQKRLIEARAAQARYSLDALPVWTGRERQAWADLQARDPAAALVQAARVAGVLPPREARQALQALAPDVPGLAFQAGLVAEGRAGAVRLQQGLQMMSDPQIAAKPPKGKERDEALAEALGRAVDHNPALRSAISETADAIYLSMVPPGLAFDGDAYGEAVRLAAGGQGQFGGRSRVNGADTLSPGWVRADRLGAVVRTLTPADWQTALSAVPYSETFGRDWKPQELAQQSRLVAVGDGIYRLERDADRPLLDRQGRPVTLDLNAVRARLAQRHPDGVRP